MTRLLLFALATVSGVQAQLVVNTVAGGAIPSGVPAQNVALNQVTGIAADAAGNIVVTEWPTNVIQRIRPDGVIETLAGNGINGYSGDGGPATQATVNWPVGPRFDAAGNLYFGDSGNRRIRRIDTNGMIATVVGDGIAPVTGMDVEGPALQRSVWAGGGGMTVTPGGALYFTQGPFVLRLMPDGTLTKIAGIENDFCQSCWSGDGGPATQAQLAGPGALAVDSAGNVYVVDGNTRIRKISPSGMISAFAGYGTGGVSAPDGTSAMNASFGGVNDLASDAAGNLYLLQITGANQNMVRRIDTSGMLSTLESGPGGYGATSAQFLAMQGGQLVAYASLTQVMRSTSAGSFVTVGGGNPLPAPDGTAARNAWFLGASSMSVNRAGDLYIAEQGACLIRKIGADGILHTAAGTGVCGTAASQQPNTTQNLAPPAKVFANSQGNLYVVDTSGNAYTVTPGGHIAPSTLANANEIVAIDGKDRIYIDNGGLIRIWPDGHLDTIVNFAALPTGMANVTYLNGFGVDPTGNVYFSGSIQPPESLTHDQVFRVNDDGSVTAVSSLLSGQNSVSLAVDNSGDIWRATFPQIAEVSGANEWQVGRAGTASYGSENTGYSGDGGPAQSARFNILQAATAPSGDFYLLESNRVRKLTGMAPPSAPQITAAGIVNALSYSGGSLAPGELVAIFGSGFGVTGLATYQLENNHVPPVLGRLKVLFNGFPGAITAATPNQINVFVPYQAATPQQVGGGVPTGSTVTVTVQVDASGASVTLPMVTTAPGIASADGSGAGQGAILNQDTTLNSNANPAPRGSVVSLFGTGDGWTSPQLVTGELTITTPYPAPLQKVAVSIDGLPAIIQYAGAAPWLPAGVWQINAQIPAAANAGSVPVAVNIGGVTTTQLLTLALK